MRVHSQTDSNKFFEVFRIFFGDVLVFSQNDRFVQTRVILSSEGRQQSTHFVDYAPQGPNVAFTVVLLMLPYLWTGVVGSTSLSCGEPVIHYLGDIEVSNFGYPPCEENIRAFDVSMDDVVLV